MPNTVIIDTKREQWPASLGGCPLSSLSLLKWRAAGTMHRSPARLIATSCLLALAIIGLQVITCSSTSFAFDLASVGQQQQQQQQQQPQTNFDPTDYKNILEAIRGHPDLREFARLCEADGVKEIVSMDRTPLTVFAPIDRALADPLAKSKSRSINLIELTRHHIAQGFVMPDENTKYPHQFSSYSLLSPLYLNQAVQQNKQSAVFVNNAKIIATHLIPIDAENYQTLHVIDQVLEFAYVNRRAQLRNPQFGAQTAGAGLSGSSGSSGGSNSNGALQFMKKMATLKRSINLDDMASQADQQSIYEFYERFGDFQSNQPQVDLYHTRIFTGSQQLQRLSLAREEFNLERLMRALRQHPQLRGRLFQVNESSSLNTYFLPLNNDELEALLENPTSGSNQALTYEAHVIPDQVLFTRTMQLGQSYATLFDRDTNTHRVSLNLAKTMPTADTAGEQSVEPSSDDSTSNSKFLATPLLVQCKCSIAFQTSPSDAGRTNWRSGLTQAEILVANIPLTNGVLHLIKRPLLVTETNVLDYLNDNDNQLSNVVNALGSKSSPSSTNVIAQNAIPNVKVNRFRELLARERQMLATFSMDSTLNKTILAPSDEAFAKLKYELRALVQGDESMIPKHWDSSYRQDLLERLLKRHVIFHQTLTSDKLELSGNLQALSDSGKLLSFTKQGDQLLIESDSSKAHILHRDLSGTNGVLHIIDRVLGEEQETVHSLLTSLVLKFNHTLEESNVNQNELNQLIQANIRSSQLELISATPTSQQQADISATTEAEHTNGNNQRRHRTQQQQPELSAISRSIGQFLDELAGSNKRQLQLLATSVNISFQLARIVSQAEGLEDWNDKFKLSDRQFTYFVPSDLAWIRLQQTQPELYKPLMYFLESSEFAQQASQPEPPNVEGNSIVEALAQAKSSRSSESSHRLCQIFERHLLVNRKLAAKDLGHLDSLQTLGATLRLVEQPGQSQLVTAASGFEGSSAQPMSAFAALHSIVTGSSQSQQHQQLLPTTNSRLKALKLDSSSSQANIVQVNEASNGFVYTIDSVLLFPEDTDYLVQTSAAPAVSSTMSSLLGAHNSAILDFIHNLLSPSPLNMSAHSILALIGTLTCAIAILLVLALVLIVRRRRQNKLNRHQQLESGLTSSSSANSGSTSTTKSL